MGSKMDKSTADKTAHEIIRDVISDEFDTSLSSAMRDAETVIVCLRDHGYEVRRIEALTHPPVEKILGYCQCMGRPTQPLTTVCPKCGLLAYPPVVTDPKPQRGAKELFMRDWESPFKTSEQAIAGALHDIVYEEDVNAIERNLCDKIAPSIIQYLESAGWKVSYEVARVPPDAPSKPAEPLREKFPVVWYEKDRIGVKLWDAGEFVFTSSEAQEIVDKLSALLNLDKPNPPDRLLEASQSMSIIIDFPSSPAYNIHNRPLTWLYTHCLAIGMTKQSSPPDGVPTAELDIALFTAELLARAAQGKEGKG